ncbi:hypothetical protein L6R29_20685 [Myxococcota bacterium]|nr:hypothetical protein [Myxococcota bacterium]
MAIPFVAVRLQAIGVFVEVRQQWSEALDMASSGILHHLQIVKKPLSIDGKRWTGA